MKMFAIFVEYSHMKRTIIGRSSSVPSVGLHRNSNEVHRNKFSVLAALLFDIMVRIEHSFKLFLFIFNL